MSRVVRVQVCLVDLVNVIVYVLVCWLIKARFYIILCDCAILEHVTVGHILIRGLTSFARRERLSVDVPLGRLRMKEQLKEQHSCNVQ